MRLKDTYEKYIEHLQMKGMSEKTINEHKRYLFGSLSHSIENKEIIDLRIADMYQVIASGREHGEYGSQRSIVVYRQLLKFLRESGYALSFDWRDIQVPKVPQKPVEYLTPEELNKVRDSLPSDMAGLRTRTLIEVLVHTGMRIAEAISLNKDDIDYETKEAKVLNVKTKEWGKVYFTDETLFWIKKYIEKRKDNLPALFVSGRGRLLSNTSRNYLRVQAKKMGIKKHIKHHIFRKTFVTTLIQNNVDVKSVQTLARHKSERTTLRYYTGVDNERAKKLHQEVMKNL